MWPRHINHRGQATLKPMALYDKWLLAAVSLIVGLGLLMVASSSIVISQQQYHQSFHYLIHQLVYLVLGIILGLAVLRVNTSYWEKISPILLLVSFGLLALILIPGVGRSVNGSIRWIGIGPFGIQASELGKLSFILFLGSYLSRREVEVRTQIMGFVKPVLIFGVMAVLLIKEPDFGTVVVLSATALGMMFLAGARLGPFITLLVLAIAAIWALAIASPYRMARLTTFIDPWSRQFDNGYQLTQSLIAFGRGGVWGNGLGESIQKMFYLPEAHTDFLFAVLAEELGLIGILCTIGLYSLLIGRGLVIARRAQIHQKLFSSYVAYGISLCLGVQAMINMGVNAGILPTKGLTLPLMSYGGSSMLISCICIALLFRIDHETRWDILGLGAPQNFQERN
jgi:cell division protein FtsW